MKSLLFFLLGSFALHAQIDAFSSHKQSFEEFITLPIYYFPFYNEMQIIVVDYYTESVELGALEDQLYPRGESSFNDAIRFNLPNGYLLRNRKGEILANYGVTQLSDLHLLAPDSCKMITHLEFLNRVPFEGHALKPRKDQFGYCYQIVSTDKPDQHSAYQKFHYGILDTLGRVVIPAIEQYIYFTNGEYVTTRQEEKHSPAILNTSLSTGTQNNEKEVTTYSVTTIYDSIFQPTYSVANHNLIHIDKNCFMKSASQPVEFMNRYGKPLHPNTYVSVSSLGYGKPLIYSVRKNDTLFQGLLSSQLNEITRPIFSYIQPNECGFMVWDSQHRKGFWDQHGKEIVSFDLNAQSIKCRPDSFVEFAQVVATPNGGMICNGLIDSTGKIILPAEYWQILPFQNGVARIQKNNKWGIMNEKGEILIPLIYDQIELSKPYIRVKQQETYGLLDYSGKVLVEAHCSYVNWFDSVIYCSTVAGQHFIIDLKHDTRFKHDYGPLTPLGEGVSRFHKASKFGLVNNRAELLLPALYDRIHDFKNNYAVIEIDGKFGLVNTSGKIVIPLVHDHWIYGNDGYELR